MEVFSKVHPVLKHMKKCSISLSENCFKFYMKSPIFISGYHQCTRGNPCDHPSMQSSGNFLRTQKKFCSSNFRKKEYSTGGKFVYGFGSMNCRGAFYFPKRAWFFFPLVKCDFCSGAIRKLESDTISESPLALQHAHTSKPVLCYTTKQKLLFKRKDFLSQKIDIVGVELPSIKEEDRIDDEIDILAALDEPFVIPEYTEIPAPPRSVTLSTYIEQSETLQKLVQIGVDLSQVEKRPDIAEKILKMDFERDIQEKLLFLTNVGVSGDSLGKYLTKNPMILDEDLHNLNARVEYLKMKKFSVGEIGKIVCGAPYFLLFTVEDLDSKLGALQNKLQLAGDDLRALVVRTPKIITFKEARIAENLFVLRKQLGFRPEEMKELILKEPRILIRAKHKLLNIFDFAHNMMEISHKLLIQNAEIFHCRQYKLEERHKFLQSLDRAQYDTTKPNYISLKLMCKLSDEAFASDVAKSSLAEYYEFLRTL